MLAICIATERIQLGATARFITAQHLANQLGRSSTSLGRQRLLRPLLACDVLVLDELGYLPTLPGFGPALYELIAPRPTQSGVVCRRRRTGHDHSAASSSGRSVVPCHWPPDQRRRATRCGETSEWCVTATPEPVDEG